jgi:hypothetical protein
VINSWQQWLKRTFPLSRRDVKSKAKQAHIRPRLEALEDRCLPSVFTVLNTHDSGAGSFRDAINRVNNDLGLGIDTIQFKIKKGTQTIALMSALPTITHSVVIDGTTQSGFAGQPLIELDGAGAGPAANGLTIAAGGSTVEGLVINRFSQDGILLEGKGGDVVEGDYVGTDVTGTVALANGTNGVEISETSNNTVGGTSAPARNLISGNQGDGVLLSSGSQNVIEGNYVGTDSTGAKALGNLGRAGVELQGENGDVIGGAASGARNLISGNSRDGLRSSGGVGILIEGNRIGTDVTGTTALGNAGNAGIEIQGDSNDVIGGAEAGAGNLVSANFLGMVIDAGGTVVEGNFIGTDVTGTKALGNASGVSLGASTTQFGGAAPGAGNLVSGNLGFGIESAFGQANVFQGNFIGTDITGTKAIPNTGSGMEIHQGEAQDVIGGAAAGAGNLISGNLGDGIFIANFCNGTTIQGNTIGTDVTGTKALGNGFSGIFLAALANDAIVGGVSAGARNLISGNQVDGVLIELGSSGNLLEGNYIGTDVSGALALGNGANGVEINDTVTGQGFPPSINNTIGSPAVGGGNLISGNGMDGVFLNNFFEDGLSGTLIQGNLIGTDVTGKAALGNGTNGVELLGGATNNTVGGASVGDGNVISGNKMDGVRVAGDISLRAPFSNSILGNRIGTDISGTVGLGNGADGIDVLGGQGNVIGGTVSGAGNVISANAGDGVFVGPSVVMIQASQNVLQGNDIGTDLTGTLALGNGGDGVHIIGAVSTAIGGAASGARNIISANHADGVLLDQSAPQTSVEGDYIGTDVTGIKALGNAFNGLDIRNGSALTTVGGPGAGAGNVISANGQNGILISGSTANTLQGNMIGTDATGKVALGNGQNGVVISIGFINTIGGTAAGSANLISGNLQAGVSIGAFSDQNVVEGNLIGTDVTGSVALGNSDGVDIGQQAGNANVIGGETTGAGNVISGNSQFGLSISGGIGNQIEGNFIGTDHTGSMAVGNGIDGVQIQGSFGTTTIGGASASARNIISGNGADGVFISFVAGTLVEGNYIGTDVSGTKSLGNSSNGVEVNFATIGSNTIGGTSAGAGNLISGNGSNGILLLEAFDTQIFGNSIGTNAAKSAALGNGGAGVFVTQFSLSNAIGGTTAGAGNTIGFNAGAGVFVDFGFGNLISGNSIYSNGALGIDLNEFNNANNSQPAPVLSSAVLVHGTTKVQGTLTAAANTAYTIEFFANVTADPSGFGEGQTFLKSITVTTDANGTANFTVNLSGVLSGQFLTATATDPSKDTSEFSNSLVVKR